MPDILYKRRAIEPQSYTSDGGRWRPKALVTTSEGGSAQTEALLGPLDALFDTAQEADVYAVRMAQLWVDERSTQFRA